jgi:hypothetical protein
MLYPTHKEFKKPNKSFYFGKAKNGTPYFHPRNYVGSIIDISIRKPFGDNIRKFKQYSRAWKVWRFSLVGFWICVELGLPIIFTKNQLGWKEKFGTPRFEYSPAIQLFFFGLELSLFFVETDKYWEQLLWTLKWCGGDTQKAKETWGWRDRYGNSSWDDSYLLTDLEKFAFPIKNRMMVEGIILSIITLILLLVLLLNLI